MTALSVYSTNTNSTTLSTARLLVTGTGAGSTNTFTSKCGTSTGYSEMYSQGTTNAWSAAGSLGSPSGNGFILETATLDLTGKQILAGTWTPRFRGKISVGTATVDIYVRAYIYNGSTYTQIGSTMSLTGQSLTTTSTDYTFAGASLAASPTFASGQYLYLDCWLNITANSSGSGSATISIVEAVSSTQGNGSSFKADTPGYATPVNKDLSMRARIQSASTSNKDLSMRARVSATSAHDLSMRARLQDISAYAATIFADSPVAYYRLGELAGTSAIDFSGNNHTATYSGSGVVYGTTSPLVSNTDTAVTFSSGGYVTVPGSVMPTGNFSIECWFRAPSTVSANGSILANYSSNMSFTQIYGAGLAASATNQIALAVADSTTGGVSVFTPAVTITPLVWYHLVGTFDTGTGTGSFYVNGDLIGTVVPGAYSPPVGGYYIGASSYSDNQAGDFDEVAIYSSVLSPSRVTAHYVAGHGRYIGQDTFVRSNQTHFGTATDGQIWNYLAGNEADSIVSNFGQIASGTGTANFVLGSKTARDMDILIRGKVTASGDHLGVLARVTDTQTNYRIYWTGGNILIIRDVADVKTTLSTTAFSVTNGTLYWLRAQVYDSGANAVINAKMWADGGAEPGSWTVTTTDTNPLTGTGKHGLHLSCGNSANTVSVNSYTAIDLVVMHDLNMRARISATSQHDLAMRANVQVPQFPSSHDLKMRARVAGAGNRDLAMRASLEEPAIPLPTTPAASFTVSSRNTTFSVKHASFTSGETIDGRSTCSFTIEDPTGTLRILHRQPIEVVHAVRGVIFRGFVNDVAEQNLVPTSQNEIKVTCIDEHWLADKRVYEGDDYSTEYAGDIAADLVRILSDEGIEANVAIDRDTTLDDFAEGTLSNVVAVTTNIATTANDGQLELAPAGTTVSITENSYNDFFAGTRSNTEPLLTDTLTSDGALQLHSFSALKFTADCTVPGGGDLSCYLKFWFGSYAIQSGDSISFDMWVSSSSPEIKAGIDFTCTDGTTLRDSGTVGAGTDYQGIAPDPNIDLKGLADDQWYTRGAGMSLAGKTIQYVTVAFGGDQPGSYEAYFRNVRIVGSDGTVKQYFFDSSIGQIQTTALISSNGYTNVALESVTAYEKTGYRISPSYDLSAVAIARSSVAAWSATVPANHVLAIESSVDAGTTWQSCTNYQAIPGVLPGIAMTGKFLAFRQTLANNSVRPTDTSLLYAFSASVQPSYAGSKQDIIATTTTDVDFGQGTLTNLVVSNDSLHLNQITRNYDDHDYSNQTWYGTSNPYDILLRKSLGLHTGASSAVDIRLDFAGQWQNFIAEVDVNIGEATGSVGFTYRTTGWQNNDNTFAYSAMVSTTAITLGRGTNSSSGAGSFSTIQTVALTLSSGNWHRLRVEVSGSGHSVYLDDVLYLSSSDSTFSAAGYIGLRFSNSSGAAAFAYFDNFGVTEHLSGTRVSPTLDLSSAGIAQDSFISWNATTPGNSSVVVESSLDSGATWATCTNGAAIPGISRGMNLIGTSLETRVTLSATNASTAPILSGLTTSVIGLLQSSGYRIAPPLSLSPVGRAGNSEVTWTASLPADDTLLGIDVSPDGTNWTDITNDNGSAIPFISGKADPWLDSFDKNAGVYSLTSLAGGSDATWAVDSANSRIVATGGTYSLYRYDDISDFGDGEIYIDSDYADNGGVAWRLDADSEQCYLLTITDDLSINATGKIRLYKVVSSTKTQLGNSALVPFPRNTPTRFKVVMTGGDIEIFVDGTLILTYTDTSPLEAGYVALRNNGGTAHFSQLRIQPYGDAVNGESVYVRQRLSTTNPLYTPQLQQLVASVYGDTISPGTLIPATTYSIVNGSTNTIAQDLDDLARQSDYWWRIKQSTLYFQPRTGQPSPWIATGKYMLVGSNVSVKRASDLYRNEQVIIGGTDVENRTETRFGDGNLQGFPTDDPIDSISSITISDQPVTFGIQGVDTDKDWYFQRGQKGIIQASNTTPLADGQKVVIEYLGIFQVVVKARRDGQIILLAAQDGTSGVVTVTEKADGLNLDAAIQLAVSRLTQYAKLSIDLEFTTLRPGLEAGQLLTIYFSQHGLLDETFLVTSVEYAPVQRGNADLIEYFKVQCTSGPSVGTWEHLFS